MSTSHARRDGSARHSPRYRRKLQRQIRSRRDLLRRVPRLALSIRTAPRRHLPVIAPAVRGGRVYCTVTVVDPLGEAQPLFVSTTRSVSVPREPAANLIAPVPWPLLIFQLVTLQAYVPPA